MFHYQQLIFCGHSFILFHNSTLIYFSIFRYSTTRIPNGSGGGIEEDFPKRESCGSV
jgi:hypothetical protein